MTQVSVKKTTPQKADADYEESKGGRKMNTSLGVRNKEDEVLSGSFNVASTQVSQKAAPSVISGRSKSVLASEKVRMKELQVIKPLKKDESEIIGWNTSDQQASERQSNQTKVYIRKSPGPK